MLNKKIKLYLTACMVAFVAVGCQSAENTVSETKEVVMAEDENVSDTEITETDEKDNETVRVEEVESAGEGGLLDAFLANKIPAYMLDEDGAYIEGYELYLNDIMDSDDSVKVGERVDLDNDGADELIIMDYYGGRFLDERDGKVVVFYQGEGTAAMAGYLEYDGAIWLYHGDITHMGRFMYDFDKYEGEIKVDSFGFYDEFWETEGDGSDVEHTYTYRDKTITKEEYAQLYKDIFGREYN